MMRFVNNVIKTNEDTLHRMHYQGELK